MFTLISPAYSFSNSAGPVPGKGGKLVRPNCRVPGNPVLPGYPNHPEFPGGFTPPAKCTIIPPNTGSICNKAAEAEAAAM